jgi:hypothetical protein
MWWTIGFSVFFGLVIAVGVINIVMGWRDYRGK